MTIYVSDFEEYDNFDTVVIDNKPNDSLWSYQHNKFACDLDAGELMGDLHAANIIAYMTSLQGLYTKLTQEAYDELFKREPEEYLYDFLANHNRLIFENRQELFDYCMQCVDSRDETYINELYGTSNKRWVFLYFAERGTMPHELAELCVDVAISDCNIRELSACMNLSRKG